MTQAQERARIPATAAAADLSDAPGRTREPVVRWLRAVVRAPVLLAALLIAIAHFVALTLRKGRRLRLPERAAWLQRWCRLALNVLDVRVVCRGALPDSGLLVANHLSYLDIVVFGALAPAIFVAKIEVRSYPLFGLMARLGGNIFIDRRKLRRLPATIAEAEAVLRSGALLIAFPESTTTDGCMLPFRPAMFEAAVRANVPVSAAHICYQRADGSFDRDLCWWGDTRLVPSVAGLFAKRQVDARVALSAVRRTFDCRKTAAQAMQAEALALGGCPGSGARPCSCS